MIGKRILHDFTFFDLPPALKKIHALIILNQPFVIP